jgi:FAD/FMN-containing dehydrogenase
MPTATLTGEVLTPDDPAYADVRPPFNLMHPDRPDLVVRCHGTADVVSAVRWARDHGRHPVVRGGGHAVAGFASTVGGMVIDLAPMHGVEVDPQARRARVGGGALWADVDRETQAFGLATPGGLVSDTGVGGLTLGGGYGWLRRRHGLSCDNLVAAEVVCADGEVRTASAEEHPELFWALRGGGGNFGVVTAFTFALHPVGPLVAAVAAFYPVEEAADVLRGFRSLCDAFPDDVTAEASVITVPADPGLPPPVHGRACILVEAMHAGDAGEGMALVRPLAELAPPIAAMAEPMPYTALQSAPDAIFPRAELRCYWRGAYLGELGDGAIDTLAALAQERPSPRTMLALMQMGGAIERADPDATAFNERTAPYALALMGNWHDARDDARNVAWVRGAHERLAPFATGTTYLNFNGRAEGGPDAGVDEGHGAKLRRLAEVKAAYDPDNLFRGNHNIAPAAAG